MRRSWTSTLLTAGLILIILCVSLLPYRYIASLYLSGHFAEAMLKYLPFCVILVLSGLVLKGRSISTHGWGTDPIALAIAAALVVEGLSALSGVFASQSLWKSGYYFVTGPLIYFLVREAMKDSSTARRTLLWSLSLASALAAAYGISEFLLGYNWLYGEVFSYENPGYSALVGSATFGRRILGTVGHPVIFGAFLLLCLPVSVLLALHSPGLGRWAGVLFSLLSLVALFLTFSRGAWLGFIAMVIFYCLYKSKRLLLIAMLTMVVFSGLVVSSDEIYPLVRSRDLYSQYVENFRSDARIKAYIYAVDILSKNLSWGTGTGTYRYIAHSMGSTLDTPDNMYLSRLVETGLLGFIAWIFLFQLIVTTLYRQYLYNKREFGKGPSSDFYLLILAGVVGMLVDMITHDALNVPLTRIIFWILIGIGISPFDHSRERPFARVPK